MVLSDSCAASEERWPKNSAYSDLSGCASSTKKPLTWTCHSWGSSLSCSLVNVVLCMIFSHTTSKPGWVTKGQEAVPRGSVWEHGVWGLGRRGQPHRSKLARVLCPQSDGLGSACGIHSPEVVRVCKARGDCWILRSGHLQSTGCRNFLGCAFVGLIGVIDATGTVLHILR